MDYFKQKIRIGYMNKMSFNVFIREYKHKKDLNINSTRNCLSLISLKSCGLSILHNYMYSSF